MIEYQNIFTQVQADAPDYPGVPIGKDEEHRMGEAIHCRIAVKHGDEKIGPI